MTSLYNAAAALAFFRSAGKPEHYAAGATIFRENARAHALLMQRHKMYYVYEGEVSLVQKKKVIASVGTGEVFGEDRLSFSDPDADVRAAALARAKGILEFAGRLGVDINVGRLRGRLIKGRELLRARLARRGLAPSVPLLAAAMDGGRPSTCSAERLKVARSRP